MSNLPSLQELEFATQLQERILKWILENNTTLNQQANNIKSPQDIEKLINHEFTFIKTLHSIIENSTDFGRKAYEQIGLKPAEIRKTKEDVAIAESWITWYKHQRSQNLGPIRELEAHLPIHPDYKIYTCRYSVSGGGLRLITNGVEGKDWLYRKRQAEEYTRIIYDIFCAPQAAPALGEPLPADHKKPKKEEIPKTRSALAQTIFCGKPYAKIQARIIKAFLPSAIKEGSTSDLLPLVLVDKPARYLPPEHPLNL